VSRPRAGTLARALFAAALTGYLLWKANPSEVWAAATAARPGPLLAAVLLVFVDRSLMAYRWLVLLRPIPHERRPSFATIMNVFFVSTFVGTFLPASVGGDAVRAYALARHDVPGAFSLASVLMDRMLGVLSVLMMAVAGLLLARDLAANPAVVVAIALTSLVCAAAAAVVFSTRVADAVLRVWSRMPAGRLRAPVARLVEAIQGYAPWHNAMLNVLMGSLGVQVLRIVQAYYLGVALGIAAPLSAYFAFIPLILLVMLLPVTINGLGTSQAAFVWAFARVGVPAAHAFALSVLFVALGVVGNLPGGVLYLKHGLPGREQRTLA
jgi:glycosyltransferase 2 family protein